jgi:hypothetical protein
VRQSRDVVELHGPVATPADEAAPLVLGGVLLRLHHVHPGLGEVLQSAGVVEVEVGQDDVAHVLGIEPQPLHLADRGLFLAKAYVEQGMKGAAEARVRLAHILQAVAGVDQHQAVAIGLDQQALADDASEQAFAEAVEDGTAEGAVGAAVQVVDPQADLRRCPSLNMRSERTFRRGGTPQEPRPAS